MFPLYVAMALPVARIWERDITVEQLARKLGYSADARVADRHLAVFAEDRPKSEIAKHAAECMGLKLAGSRFEPDPAYERLVDGYELELRSIAVEGVRKAAALLRANPPKKKEPGPFSDPVDSYRTRRDFSWAPGSEDPYRVARLKAIDRCAWAVQENVYASLLISKCSRADLEQLLDGNYVVGTTPHRGNTVMLPGSPDDYSQFRTSAQGFLAIRFHPSAISLGSYTPGQQSPNSTSMGTLLFQEDVRGRPAQITRLGEWSQHWRAKVLTNPLFSPSKRDLSSAPGEDGELLEWLAMQAKVPLVAQRMPWAENGPSVEWRLSASLARMVSGYLLIKPADFWLAKEVWQKREELMSLKFPSVADPVAALDWASKLCLSQQGMSQYFWSMRGTHLNLEAFGGNTDIAQFWMSLNRTEKAKLLRESIPVSRFSSKSKVHLRNAALTCIFSSSIPRGDISAWLESSSECSVLVESNRRYWLIGPNGGGSSCGGNREEAEQFARANRRPGDQLYDTLMFKFRFVGPKGEIAFDGRIPEPVERSATSSIGPI